MKTANIDGSIRVSRMVIGFWPADSPIMLHASSVANTGRKRNRGSGGVARNGCVRDHLQRTIRNRRVWRTLPHENRYQRRFVPLSIIRHGVRFTRHLATIRHTIENYSIMRYGSTRLYALSYTISLVSVSRGHGMGARILSLVRISRLIVADSPR